ncbi:MAG: phosphatase PAP2 family protein [Acidobacteria bacterium]|nr:phosphatase PAP2 family protein [Acidobacteriota bacterium]
MAVLGVARALPAGQQALLLAAPVVLGAFWVTEEANTRAWSRITREWVSLGLLLCAYWTLQVFASAYSWDWQRTWIGWDRWLLEGLGLKRVLEATGQPVPFALEFLYLLLYAIPPASMGVLYLCGERRKTRKYLLVLYLGTLTAYALLPFIPVASPRAAFPGLDVPTFHSWPRSVNLWLLDHLDISTSVFPSGHVAVAFSSAFGLLSAVPGRPRVWVLAFVAAVLVYIATIYGRYHYAVDGLASIAITTVAWRVAEKVGTE